MYYLMQTVNFLVFLSGIALLFSAFYLYITVKHVNSFIILIGLVASSLILTSMFGAFCTKNSPTGLSIYVAFLFILTIFTVVLAFFLIFDKEEIVDFLTSNMKDSYHVIGQAKKLVYKNLEITKMGMFVYACLLVFIYNTGSKFGFRSMLQNNNVFRTRHYQFSFIKVIFINQKGPRYIKIKRKKFGNIKF
jgi:hypothetical protein